MPLVLVNGLAEQPETWFANKTYLSRQFDVKVPEILVYDGASLHDWIDSGGEVTVEYLADRLGRFLDEFVQRPPYHLVGSSLGSQVILTYATRCPEKVSKLVLICPSGFHGDENLPMIEGVTAQQLRIARQVGLSPRPFRQRRAGAGPGAEVSGPEMEERGLEDAAGHGRAFGRHASGTGSAADAGDLGGQRSRAVGCSRRDPRGRANPQGATGRDPQVRPRARRSKSRGW